MVGDVVRYGFAAMVVACGMAAIAWLGQSDAEHEAAEVDSAVLIDLPPAEASSAPAIDAADGPEQATSAAAALQAPPEPAKEPAKPADTPTPVAPPTPLEQPPPPVKPDPAAVLERKPEDVSKPPTATSAPPMASQEDRAPQGAAQAVKTEADSADERRPHASKHAITLWQRALIERLDHAKHLVGRQKHASGTVKVGFTIGASGALVSERVVQSSGLESLDATAMTIVRRASPFPPPPAGSSEADARFIIPVQFR